MKHYDIPTGTLTLQHAYPPSSPGQPYRIALADVNLLLETIKSTETQVGEWVNVMGYVKDRDASTDAEASAIQATMLWSAGSVRLEAYERSVEQWKQIRDRKRYSAN